MWTHWTEEDTCACSGAAVAIAVEMDYSDVFVIYHISLKNFCWGILFSLYLSRHSVYSRHDSDMCETIFLLLILLTSAECLSFCSAFVASLELTMHNYLRIIISWMHTDSINHLNNDNSVWCACRANGVGENTDKQDRTRNTTHTPFGDNFFLSSQRSFDFVSHFSFFDGLFGDELGQNTSHEHEHVAFEIQTFSICPTYAFWTLSQSQNRRRIAWRIVGENWWHKCRLDWMSLPDRGCLSPSNEINCGRQTVSEQPHS